MAFDPTTLFPGAAGDREGAIFKIRPENLWQNTAGTTAVTTDGDEVRRIDDISVNGRDVVSVITSQPLIYHTDGTVHWLTSAGNSQQGFESEVDWTFMSGNPYTIGAAVSFDTPSAGDQYFFTSENTDAGTNNDSRIHCGARSGTQITIAHWFNDANFSHTTATATAERHICEYTNPGSEYTIDGTSVGSNGSTPGALDEVGAAYIMYRLAGNVSLDGNLYGMIIVADSVTTQEKADIDEWLQEQIEGEPTEQTVVVGLAGETSAATAAPGVKVHTSGQASETSSANAVASTRSLALLPAAEASAATAVSGDKVHTSGQAAETDAATAIVGNKTFAAGLAAETSAANATTSVKEGTIGQAAETSTANVVVGAKAFTLGQSTEISAANAAAVTRIELALQAAEENNAIAVTITRAWAVGQAVEANGATQITAASALNVGLAAETATTQPVGHFRVATLGLSAVTDTAQPTEHSRAKLMGLSGETNTASSLGHSRLAAVGLATEGSAAGDVTATGGADSEPGEGGFWVIRRRRRWV